MFSSRQVEDEWLATRSHASLNLFEEWYELRLQLALLEIEIDGLRRCHSPRCDELQRPVCQARDPGPEFLANFVGVVEIAAGRTQAGQNALSQSRPRS
jgi:hypothetical protein